MAKTIFCLFSIRNDYDQPRNNLVAWWSEKPSFDAFCECFNVKIKDEINIVTLLDKYGDVLMAIKEIYNGKQARVFDYTNYRLEEVAEATKLLIEFDEP